MHKNWGKNIRYIFHFCASAPYNALRARCDTVKECIFGGGLHTKTKKYILNKNTYLSISAYIHKKSFLYFTVFESQQTVFSDLKCTVYFALYFRNSV